MATTIVAISTPPGIGGVAVIRMSGADAFRIASAHVTIKEAPGTTWPTVHYALFRRGGEVVDEVVVTCFRSPHSYTGEDVVEISCHGSLYVQQALLEALLDSGAEMAEPGEFTRRAFLNGKLDLSQAEAVADLIDSTNAGGHQLAISQLRGGYAQRLKELRKRIVELASLLELELDFSEEDVEFADREQLVRLLDELEAEARGLVESFELGNAIKNGMPVAIVGKPNVGKSTLLNALVGEERAIVSDRAGTTRDTIEDAIIIAGVLFRFIDTAGIRRSDDTIESLGIERSYGAVAEAGVVLYLVDATQPFSVEQDLQDLAAHVDLGGKRLVVLCNKADSVEQLQLPPTVGGHECLAISAKTGMGLDQLKHLLGEAYRLPDRSHPVLSNVRHFQALKKMLEATAYVRQGLEKGLPADLVVVDLREALHHLGSITGQVTSDEILGTIFHRFCVGK